MILILVRKYGSLPQDEQFHAMFGFSMDKLVDYKKSRTGDHYKHADTGDGYCWHWQHKWYPENVFY